MKKRLFPGLSLCIFAAIMIMALVPFTASAASLPAAVSHQPHLLLKQSLVKSNAAVPFAPAATNMTYHGGPVMSGTSHVFTVFWEPQGKVAANYNNLINQYFGDIGGSGLYHINTQYTNSAKAFPSNSTLGGSWVDTKAYPRATLLDTDIQTEVSRALSVNGWTASLNNIFFVFTQANQNVCISGNTCASNTFCAYHNFFGSNTLYATMPYAASFSCNPGFSPNSNDADQTINVSSHEQMEAATDPLLNAWFDSSGAENGDKCAWTFGTVNSRGANVTVNSHSYILQREWDNKIRGCALTGP